MGVRFSLQHSNIVAYLTNPGPAPAPRMTRQRLYEFLTWLMEEAPESMVSYDPSWVDDVRAMASEALNRFRYIETQADEALDPSFVETALADLKPQFSQYQLFGLFVGGRKDSDARYVWTRTPS